MSAFGTGKRWIPHLSRAIVAFTGFLLFHLLAGDAFASWSLLGVAAFALFARINGMQEKRVTRIELSIAATACLLLFIQGGFIEHFNRFTLPLGLCTLLLLGGLNAINLSAPQFRIVATPILLVLFFTSQRYFYPFTNHSFENPLLAIGLIVAAWELLSALIHSKENHPSWIEAGAALALLFVYYSQTANFLVAATLASCIILAYFLSSSQSKENQYPNLNQSPWIKAKGIGLGDRRSSRAYATLFIVGMASFVTIGWILGDRFSELPPLNSLKKPAKPLAVEQRNRMEQAFLAFNEPESRALEPLRPLNLNILEEALRSAVERKPSSNRRNVLIRRATSSDYKGLNVDTANPEPIRTTRISKMPGLRISAPSAPQSLPDYTITTEVSSEEAPPNDARSISYDFGFGTAPEDPEPSSPSYESIEIGAEGSPIRLADSTPLRRDAAQPSSTPEPSARPPSPQTPAPRNIQASVGYSPELEYASNVSVRLRTNPVLEVYLPGSAKWTNQLYLRFNALEDIRNDRFVQADRTAESSHAIDQSGWNQAPGIFRSQSDGSDPWTLALAYDWKSPLPVLGPFSSIRIPEGTALEAEEDSFTIRRTKGSGSFAYQLAGLQLPDTIPLSTSRLTQEELDRLTALPLSKKDVTYLKRLAARIGGRRSDADAFARRVGSYFERTHPYAFDFEFKQGEEHLLVSWLKSRSPGICGYYAGAFTLLARAQGIPARVVVGAFTREFDSRQRKFVVRDRDAHAWAEYLNENNQWVRADLTPISLESPRFAQGETRSESYTTSIQAALDRLDQDDDPPESAAALASLNETASSSESSQSDADSNLSIEANESMPRTLDLIDQVLSREAESTNEILEATATLVPDSTPPPIEEAIPPPVPVLAESASSPAAAPMEARLTTPVPAASLIDETIPATHAKRTLSHRVVVNYLLVLVLVAFVISQFIRTRRFTTHSELAKNHPASRERSLAGRLLREIEALYKNQPDRKEEWHALHQRALQLRYSPFCSPDEIKALKRDFRKIL